ncbi:aspartate carbamoyltransferase catalytic subunit [Celeribacter sp.]|uniref:aspartate carbamoyltransferase catalytic subunit n=1 Tax=Celeribacter sp. TaxID=1890673 RepID=UPI003A95DDAA
MTDGWDGILRSGERILWQGQPVPTHPMSKHELVTMVAGLGFCLAAVLWMISAYKTGGFWPFGLIHMAVGLIVGFGPKWLGMYARRNTWFSLSNSRAFFAMRIPLAGPSLNAIEITPHTGIDFDGDDPGTIRFRAEAVSITGNQTLTTPQFDTIPDARAVFALIRDIQRGIA